MRRVCERERVGSTMLNPETPKRRLAVDLSELESAFEDASWEMSHYLDLETGQIVTLTDEIHQQWEDLFENDESGLDGPIDLAEAVRKTDLPEWEKDALIEADQIEAGYGTRYLGIPQSDSHEGYRDMEAFIATIPNEHMQDRLWRAIGGRGAFRNFKDVLADFPRERERWFEFKDTRLRRRVLAWLESQGIEPVIE